MKNAERFNSIFDEYMIQLAKQYEKDSKQMKEMRIAFDEKLENAKKAGDEAQYQQLKKMSGMMFAFTGIDNWYISASMIEKLAKYEENMSETDRVALSEMIIGWYRFLHTLCPSAKTATTVADVLIGKGRTADAIEVLEEGITEGSKAAGVEPEDVAACQAKLEQLKSGI